MRKALDEKCRIKRVTCSGVIKNTKHAQFAIQWNWLHCRRAQETSIVSKKKQNKKTTKTKRKENLNHVSFAEFCASNEIVQLEKSHLYKYQTRVRRSPFKHAFFLHQALVAHRYKRSPLPVRAGGRILILVRQADPRFTPRVWLVPIVHCQGLLMEGQQWIPYPHKWLSDRAPSSITSYNVEVQKMGPLGGLIWCFICSFEILLNVLFSPSLQQLYVPVHACSGVNRINLRKTMRVFVGPSVAVFFF